MKNCWATHFLVATLIFATLGCGRRGDQTAAVRVESPRPPIILISIDTLRADRLPIYGYQGVETPALEAMRARSILFSKAYTSVPLTLPAHASLLTGTAPYEHGIRDNIGYSIDNDSVPTLASRLSELGYSTGAFVSSYVLRGRTGLASGFDEYDDGVDHGEGRSMGDLQRSGMATIAAAGSFLKEARGEPFFLFLHLFEPHAPYDPPEPFRTRYRDPYDGEIAAVDAILGEFFEHLELEGLLDDSLIILVSDHGEGLGDHGEQEHGILLYPETTRIPMLVKLPGGERGGETVERPVELLDVVPTILEWLGTSDSEHLSGYSLLGHEPAERSIYLETYYPRIHLGWSELRSLVTPDYQYIDAPRAELYDLGTDPTAKANVLRENRRVGAELSAELEGQTEHFSAPLFIDAEDADRLRSLGYLATVSTRRESRPVDPKDGLPALAEMAKAFALAQQGRCDLTVEILEDLLTLYPGMMDARCQLATCLEKLGRLEEALEHYREILLDSPQVADEVLIAMGKVLLQQQRWQEAQEHARMALDSLPSEANQLLARIAQARGRSEEALALAAEAAQADRLASPEAVLLLANSHLRQNELEEALELLEELEERVKSKRVKPIPTLDFARGSALARLGRIGEAEEAFLFEIKNFPNHLRAYEELCILYASVRRRDLVEPLLEAMMNANPASEATDRAAVVRERIADPSVVGVSEMQPSMPVLQKPS